VVSLLLLALPVPGSGLWPRSYLANLPMPTPAAWSGAHEIAPRESAPCLAGVNASLEAGCPAAEVPRALEELDRLSLDWARTEIPWAGVEPERGRFDWQRWDGVVDGLRARNYRVLGMLCYWTAWVDPHSDAAIEEFGRYAERVARRYRGRVGAWEIWNEPNERTFWQATPERYVRLMRAAYEGVKRGDPDVIVLGGSTSGVDLPYLRTLLKLGAGRWMDALSVHPYSFGWRPEDAYLIAELRGAAAEMRRAGKSDRLWVTEIGLNVPSEVAQAQLLERIWILLQQSGVVEAAFWYTLYVPNDPVFPLYRADWTEKETAKALRRIRQRLAGSPPRGSALPADHTLPWGAGTPYALSPLQAWCFGSEAEKARVLWSPTGRTTIPPADSSVEVVESAPAWEPLPGAGK
jgi:hypothetical protein